MENNFNANTNQEIDFYLKIAFEIGIDKAIEAILKRDNHHLLDEFHDKLIFELRKKRGDF